MFIFAESYEKSVDILSIQLTVLKKQGYHIKIEKFQLKNGETIEKIIIMAKTAYKRKLVISSGLHGIEGYIGNASIITFLKEILPLLCDDVEVVIYPALNPYGMKYFQRTNDYNVDLNRNFLNKFDDSINDDYLLVQDFLSPKEVTNPTKFNMFYFYKLGTLLKKYGTKRLNNAILLGQNVDGKGLYYCGKELQEETNYVITQFKSMLDLKDNVTWIDIHSGYGPKYQLSIINSKYEEETSINMIKSTNNIKILGINDNEIYDTKGDILEKLYELYNSSKRKSDFYATCFEFGTMGESTFDSIQSLKAMTLSNYLRFIDTKDNVKEYAKRLMIKQFLPGEPEFRLRTYEMFKTSITEVLSYKKLVK